MNYRFKRFLIDNFDTIGFYTEIWRRTPEKGKRRLKKSAIRLNLPILLFMEGNLAGIVRLLKLRLPKS